MTILKGVFIGEETYTNKKDFVVRTLGVKEENRLLPRLVQVKPDYVHSFKVGDKVELNVYLSAYDVNSKKFLTSNVKFSLIESTTKQ